MEAIQPHLFDAERSPAPIGLIFDPEFFTCEDERALINELERLEFREVVMHGAPRTVLPVTEASATTTRTASQSRKSNPCPPGSSPCRRRCADLAQVQPQALVEALVQGYPEVATIGWHRDAPAFGRIVGVSLASSARMRFRRGSKGNWTTRELDLPSRSDMC